MPTAAAKHESRRLASLRRTLERHPRLNRAVQVSRALVHYGPWRHVARAVIRVSRPPRTHAVPAERRLLPELDPQAACSALRSDGVYVVGTLPRAFVSELRSVTDALPLGEFGRFHEPNAEVRRLVSDEAVVSVVRTYLGAEPELLECNLVVGGTEDDSGTSVNGQLRFHFDYAGWHSLNLFVYLTDVEPDAGAHQVVLGTHRSKRLRHVLRPWLSEEEVAASFGDRIRTIAGPAGTLFFENTDAFHRRRPVKGRRVMLNILWASHRGLLMRGRLTRPYAAYLRRLEQLTPGGAGIQKIADRT